MFNIFNIFKKKTDSEKIAEAKFDKSTYSVQLLKNGKYSYSWLNSRTICQSSSEFETIEDVIKQLEYNTESDAKEKQVEEMERVNII